MSLTFYLADRIAPDSILLCGLDPVGAGREDVDPLFCSEIEERITDMLTQKGVTVAPNPRWYISQPEAQQDLPSRLLDICVVDKKTGKLGNMEIDGATYHAHRKVEDARRDQVLKQAGIHFIQRYSATACYADPCGVVEHFLRTFREFCDTPHSGGANDLPPRLSRTAA